MGEKGSDELLPTEAAAKISATVEQNSTVLAAEDERVETTEPKDDD